MNVQELNAFNRSEQVKFEREQQKAALAAKLDKLKEQHADEIARHSGKVYRTRRITYFEASQIPKEPEFNWTRHNPQLYQSCCQMPYTYPAHEQWRKALNLPNTLYLRGLRLDQKDTM